MESSHDDRYPKVFEPVDVGSLHLRNRIFIPGHTTNLAEDFLPSDRHVAYFTERARGGVGMIIVGAIRVHSTSVGRAGGLTAIDERVIPGFSKIVTAVHDQGAAVLAQITHSGRHSDNVFLREVAWGPSAVPWTTMGHVPHEMTVGEIAEVVGAFVRAAEFMREAEFDGLEVHLGHGHLLHQFLSPASNRRIDRYGGSQEGRMRFASEVLAAVFDAVGKDLVIGVRVSGDEFVEGGLDAEASRQIVSTLVARHPIQFVNVSLSAYTRPSIGLHVADMNYGPTPFVDLAYAVRDAVPDVPVFAACRFTDLGLAEAVLATNRIDLVGMVRAHIADPHILSKTREGRADQIRPCVSCNFCIGQIAVHRPITCMMNPTVGRESEWSVDIPKADVRRKVLIVGGGPSGLEAARVAAERGHSVRLWEKQAELGGQVLTGRNGHGRSDLAKLVKYMARELSRLGVTIELGRTVESGDIIRLEPDVVVIATGSSAGQFDIEGWGPVPAGEEILADTGMRELVVGKHVVVVDLVGNWTSASVLETLANAGAAVTCLVPSATLLPGINEYSHMTYVDRLGRAGVTFRLLRRPISFREGDLVTADTLTGNADTIQGVDMIVACSARQADASLHADLDGKIDSVRVVGDALAPRTLLEAVFEGHRVGRNI